MDWIPFCLPPRKAFEPFNKPFTPPSPSKLADLKPLISYGASPRASINLLIASKAMAFMKRRAYVIPEDVRQVCPDILRHRIGLSYEAEAENISQEDIITSILNSIEVP